jgi:integration host factor subunit beta
MTKYDLVKWLAHDRKLPLQRTESVVDAVLSSMEQAMSRGERIEIRGFGTFRVRNYKGYEGRNPKTGEVVQVAPKRMPFFKVGKNLAASIDHGREKKQEG